MMSLEKYILNYGIKYILNIYGIKYMLGYGGTDLFNCNDDV